jgi:hypothetical protein
MGGRDAERCATFIGTCDVSLLTGVVPVTGDTTPRQQVVELIAGFIAREVGDADLLGIMRGQAERLTKELADAGLLQGSSLRSSEASPTGEDVEKVAQVLRDCKKVVRDERDYETFCARRVLAALRGEER